jgi:hypothetical protein
MLSLKLLIKNKALPSDNFASEIIEKHQESSKLADQ